MTETINKKHEQLDEFGSYDEFMRGLEEFHEKSKDFQELPQNSVDSDSELLEASDADSEDPKASTLGKKPDGSQKVPSKAENFDKALVGASLNTKLNHCIHAEH